MRKFLAIIAVIASFGFASGAQAASNTTKGNMLLGVQGSAVTFDYFAINGLALSADFGFAVAGSPVVWSLTPMVGASYSYDITQNVGMNFGGAMLGLVASSAPQFALDVPFLNPYIQADRVMLRVGPAFSLRAGNATTWAFGLNWELSFRL